MKGHGIIKVRESCKSIVGAVPKGTASLRLGSNTRILWVPCPYREISFLVFPRGKTPVLKMNEVYLLPVLKLPVTIPWLVRDAINLIATFKHFPSITHPTRSYKFKHLGCSPLLHSFTPLLPHSELRTPNSLFPYACNATRNTTSTFTAG